MPTSTSTSHTRKRHITAAQSNKLTSYFSPLPANHTYPTTLDYADSTAYAGTTLSPPVPTEIQSSLLNVGMRVRKAVPEGYKNTLTGFKPKPLLSSQQQQQQQQISHAEIVLVPFCGMHKIGGLAVQPQVQHDDHTSPYPALSFDGRLEEENENDFPLSSQESVMTNASTDSMPRQRRGVNNKRGFSDEEEDDHEDVVETMTAPRRMAKARGVRGWARDVKRTVSGEAEMDFGEVDWLVPDETSDGMEM